MKKHHKIVGHIHPSFYNFPPHIRIDVRRLYGWGERWLKHNGLRQVLGSATPASDLQDLMLNGKLSLSERDEAREYFACRGGLDAVAAAERNFCIDNDI